MGYQLSDTGSDDIVQQITVSTPTRKSTIRQWTGGLIASLGMWSVGSTLGWSSPTVPQLENGDGIDALTQNQVSWAASIVMLTALFGCFGGGYLSEKIGRRMMFILGAFPFLGGWAVVAAGQNAWMIILGRAILGLGCGTYMTLTSVFCTEITEDRLRSKIVSFLMVGACLGILYSFVIGALVHWRVNTIIIAATPAVVLAGMLYLPETPRFLVTKGSIDEACKSLQWYRGAKDKTEVQGELDKLMRDFENSTKRVKCDDENGLITESIFVGPIVKPVLISLVVASLQQLCGTTAVTFYTVDIFDAAGTDIHPNVSSIIYATTQLVGTAVAGLLMTRFGRRPLFLFSEVGMAVSLGALGVFYYLKEEEPEMSKNLAWLPLVSLMGFTIAYCFGAGILPFAIIADLSPPQIKGPATAVCIAASYLIGFTVGYVFPSLVDSIQPYGAFWLFSGLCGGGAVLVALILPETKDKSIDEIQGLFRY